MSIIHSYIQINDPKHALNSKTIKTTQQKENINSVDLAIYSNSRDKKNYEKERK
jgi:hypothetical protein